MNSRTLSRDLNFSSIFPHRRASAAKRDSILLAGALLRISSRGNFEFASSNSYSRIVGDLLSSLLSLSLSLSLSLFESLRVHVLDFPRYLG